MTPVLAGGLAAAAAAPTGTYVSGFLGTLAGSALGALAGRWVSMSPPEISNQNP